MIELICGDIHLSENPRDEYRFEFLPWLTKQVKKRDAGRAIILGDLTHKKNRHPAWLVNRVVDQIHDLGKACPVVILMGNHDYDEPDNPFFNFLNHVYNVSLIVRPTVDGKYLFLPHTRNYEKEWANGIIGGHDCVFAHQTFTGAESEGGRKLEGVPLSVFKNTFRVISGDIHVPQKIRMDEDTCGYGNGYLYYVGSPFRVNFGDNFNPRILQSYDGKLTSVLTPMPMKHLLEGSIQSITRALKKDSEPVLGAGDMLKIRVHMDREEYGKWPKTRQQIRDMAENKALYIDSIKPVVKTDERIYQSPDIAQSDEELIRSYATRVGADDATIAVGNKLAGA